MPGPVVSLIAGGDVSKENASGYVSAVFDGKNEQMESVMEFLDENGFIPEDFVDGETRSFYNSLGIDDMYFKSESVENISNNILALYAGKVNAFSKNDKRLEVRLDRESEDRAMFIDTTSPGISVLSGPLYEQRIDEKYLNSATPDKAYRLESFRSTDARVRCYFVYKCDFVNPKPDANETDLAVISDKSFLERATPNTMVIYQHIVKTVTERTGPVIQMIEIEGTKEKRLVIGFKQGTAMGIFSALSDLYHYYGCTSARKYVEQFSNGVTVMSIYLCPVPTAMTNPTHPPIETSIYQIMKEVSLLYCIPQNMFQAHFISGKLSLQETIYAHCVCHFVGHFLNRLGSEYTSVSQFLDPNNAAHAETLNNLKRRFRQETFTADYIFEVINDYPELIHSLYLGFAGKYWVQTHGADELPSLSSQRLRVDRVLNDEELMTNISRSVRNEHQEKVMNCFITFNQHVLKTNFYTPTKVALSFRMCPKFLPSVEYPQPLYGMFFVVGSEFRGFHLRFGDIARGGIRIVKSRSRDVYSANARSVFDENYNLASTQHRKNKDIPESGAKGVVLLDEKHQDKEVGAFKKYIDAILDLLLEPKSPGIKDPIIDFYKKPEILFMGPDENTAGLVDWATTHAKARAAPFWKSFFTGKSPSLGGMPHDTYGMTSLGVREFVLGIYRKMNVNPLEMVKLQIGGPDGDLGSNEILLSNEKYAAIVDGSGVLVDPKGLNHDELIRLATKRAMISEFDMAKLSSDGYRVLLDDVDVTLPDGEVVNNGTMFRNNFHLRTNIHYDVFVPCGGRPEAIDLNNVTKLMKDGKCAIPFIVEGANLFISQDAKLRLENAGAILFKDASANKGGVLASLAFDDTDFVKHMCVGDGNVPEFYANYVKEVQKTIQHNARLEFEALWREHKVTGKAISILSDELSLAITKLDEELQETELWKNIQLRDGVLREALPKCLVEVAGLDEILKRVPINYLRSIFGSYLASRFIYEYGCNSSQFAFFDL
ncbi:NAD-dependent glutamate dehydrogenase [Maublancomyces gigas]|uniref:NAD-specific glutamate dehydrogenase n=1 Tax=Discina gigas TaxID=1032678 RepID=A0ABR3GQT1_9PEZI